MARDTTTTRAPAPAPAPAGMGALEENEAMRRQLHDMDCIVSAQADAIRALAAGASKLLGLNPHDLEHVRALLAVISSTAIDLQNTVNWGAEQFGANHVDEDERAWSRALWDRWHALKGTVAAAPPVAVGAPA